MSVLRRQKVQKANLNGWGQGVCSGFEKKCLRAKSECDRCWRKAFKYAKKGTRGHARAQLQPRELNHSQGSSNLRTFNPDHLCLLLLSNWDQHFLQLGIKGSTIKGGIGWHSISLPLVHFQVYNVEHECMWWRSNEISEFYKDWCTIVLLEVWLIRV